MKLPKLTHLMSNNSRLFINYNSIHTYQSPMEIFATFLD